MLIVQKQFMNWMTSQINKRGRLFKDSTASAYAYALNSSLPLFNFEDFKQETVFEITDSEICKRLFEKCLHHPKFREINMKDDNGAFKNAMELYIRFLEETDFTEDVLTEKTEDVPKIRIDIDLPFPTSELIEKYNDEWFKLNKYPEQEKILENLFSNSDNSNFETILTKTIYLNEFYSTRLDNVIGMARHIEKLNIDSRLKANDLTLLEDIANTPSEMNNAYSFASKYCCWHKPDVYPILDSYAKGVLYKMNKKYKFMPQFTRNVISYSYDFYCMIYEKFIQYFNLQNYTLKQIDRFLWLFGKENKIKLS